MCTSEPHNPHAPTSRIKSVGPGSPGSSTVRTLTLGLRYASLAMAAHLRAASASEIRAPGRGLHSASRTTAFMISSVPLDVVVCLVCAGQHTVCRELGIGFHGF